MPFSPVNPTATNGSASLSVGVTLTGSSGVFSTTGLSVTLPEAGTYLLMAEVRTTVQVSAGAQAYISLEFYNATDAAVVAGSFRFAAWAGAVNVAVVSTTPMQKIVTVSASKVIQLWAARNNGGTYLNSSVDAGTTEMSFVKLA